jgi:thiol:disulfide interchange protein DsbG
MRNLTTLVLALVALSAQVCSAGNWVAPPVGSAAGLMQRLDRAHWISTGAKSPGRIVYVFTDPNCPYCNDLWKAMRNVRAPDVQIRYLLVAVIAADSRGKDAAILESAQPAATFEQSERNFDKGGVAPKAQWRAETTEAISGNEALMTALHIPGTPGLVYLESPGEVKVFAGMPDAKQLQAIVGK